MPPRLEQSLGLARGCHSGAGDSRGWSRVPGASPGTLWWSHPSRQHVCQDVSAVGTTARALRGLLCVFIGCTRCSSPAWPGPSVGAAPPQCRFLPAVAFAQGQTVPHWTPLV